MTSVEDIATLKTTEKNSHKTAARRGKMSRPITAAMKRRIITRQTTVLDYGCGYGDDVRMMNEQGIDASGWDPHHAAKTDKRKKYDIVCLLFVINTIADREKRENAILEAWKLANVGVIIAARTTTKIKNGTPFMDGDVTRSGTFQKLYRQAELVGVVSQLLGVEAVSIGTGIVYAKKGKQV